MAIILQVPQQSYASGQRVFQPTLSSNMRQIDANFTRVGWPDGEVLKITIKYPDGTDAGGAGFSGGSSLNRAGQPISSIGLRSKDTFLPQGQYTIIVDVLQSITTAVTVNNS